LLGALVVATAAAAAPGDPERRAIRPADQAWARRANLRAADLPAGYTSSRTGSRQDNAPLTCPGFKPDLSDLTITGEALSPVFQSRAGTTIFSAAEVYSTVRDEHESWRRTARREALRCVARMMDQISAQGLRVTVTSRVVRPAPRVGERSISFRIGAKVEAQGVTIPAWFDLIGVARGRADATLLISSVARPPSASLEQKLLATLARRLKR
jgi:hypothetical protein